MAFAASSGFKPVSSVFCVHGSARSTAQNEPMGAASIFFLKSFDGSTLFFPVFVYISQPSGQTS